MRETTLPKALVLGLVGGWVGTILMDLVMMATFISVDQPADLFFTKVGERLGGDWTIGVVLHNIIGMSGGVLFALLVMTIPALKIDEMRKGLLLGVAAGVITIPLGCVPLAIWLGESIVGVVAFSTMPHLVWGTVLGWTMARGLLRPTVTP